MQTYAQRKKIDVYNPFKDINIPDYNVRQKNASDNQSNTSDNKKVSLKIN